ncbi:UNKNOWN [Stylonychia lemnae]|uniref:Uncharacterized protein n=1 Tax=Stylonychia lemnae TaxID=5949 RepID=A0A077ZSY0_STYLE|nr:UNKNOWN [Stylonychia lemnae]|eukprot:CDW72992.1 UNKNOWN [Stylonychia lemnae]
MPMQGNSIVGSANNSLKKFINVQGTIASRNNSIQGIQNYTQNFSYNRGESPYREIIMNKTQDIKRSGLSRSPLGTRNQGQIQNQQLSSKPINKGDIFLNKNLKADSAINNKNIANLFEPLEKPENSNSVPRDTMFIQRQSTLNNSSINRLSKSPLITANDLSLRNDKKLQKIHNIYLKNQLQQQHPGSNKEYPIFQTHQNPQHSNNNSANQYIHQKRKIKPSTAGNPSTQSAILIKQSNQQSHNNQQKITQNYFPYDNMLQSRSKSPQKIFGNNSKQAQLNNLMMGQQSQQSNLHQHSEEYIQASLNLTKQIDSLFNKKKFSYQPLSQQNQNNFISPSQQAYPISNNSISRNLSQINRKMSEQSPIDQTRVLMIVQNNNYDINIHNSTTNNHNTNNFLNKSHNDAQNKKQQQPQNMRGKFIAVNNSTKAQHNSRMNNDLLPVQERQQQPIQKTNITINLPMRMGGEIMNPQQLQNQQSQHKLGSKEEARDKLLKLLKKQQNQVEDLNSTSIDKIKSQKQQSKGTGVGNSGSIKQLQVLSKTQNYCITKIIDENDTLEDEISENKGFLEITQTIETDLNNDTIEISNFNDQIESSDPQIKLRRDQILDNQLVINTPNLQLIMAPSDDFSDVENPESADKQSYAQGNITNSSNNRYHYQPDIEIRIQLKNPTIEREDVVSLDRDIQDEMMIDLRDDNMQNKDLAMGLDEYIDDDGGDQSSSSMVVKTRKNKVQNLILEEMQPLYYFNVKPTQNGNKDFESIQSNDDTVKATQFNSNSALKEASTPFFLGSPVNPLGLSNTYQSLTTNNNMAMTAAFGGNFILTDAEISANRMKQISNTSPAVMKFDHLQYDSFAGSQRSEEDFQ